MNNFKIKALIVASVLLFVSAIFATSTIKLNLAQIAEKSGRIFVGKCLAISEGTIPGPGGGQIPYTSYTFAVSKSVKGSVGNTITIRQLGYRNADYSRGYSFSIAGLPSYKVGEEVILLLTKESRLGLTAPVGLAQGCFQIYVDAQTGQKRVVNGLGNAGLFSQMESGKFRSANKLTSQEINLLSQKKGAIEYDSFVSLLEKIAR